MAYRRKRRGETDTVAAKPSNGRGSMSAMTRPQYTTVDQQGQALEGQDCPVVASETVPTQADPTRADEQAAKARPRLGVGEQFRAFIASGWAPRSTSLPAPAEVAAFTAQRRAQLGAAFPGKRLIIPAGGLQVRSNDCDYVFRPHSAFAYYTGLGADREPDAVLVLDPHGSGREQGHEAALYIRPLGPRDTDEFFADSRYGEFWVGPRPTVEQLHAELGLAARHSDELAALVDSSDADTLIIRDADPALTARLDTARGEAAEQADQQLAHHASVQRMVKDPWEIEQLREAVHATHRAFDAVVAALPEAVARGRGERWVEGVFGLHARHAGNGVGYDSICAAGDHANTLHWIRNTGDLREGELILLDAGVELDSLYTADITRTLPINGRFSPAQRQVYEAVLQASRAAIAVIRPGVAFSEVHRAAITVIATRLHEWGLLPEGVSVQQSLAPEGGQFHRRWMVHGTSHHLGLDVHDCNHATRQEYTDRLLEPGMVFTVEPGLYFKADDLLVPEELRGIGVRIEDNIVVTDTGCEVLSSGIPVTPGEVERWVQEGR